MSKNQTVYENLNFMDQTLLDHSDILGSLVKKGSVNVIENSLCLMCFDKLQVDNIFDG